MAEMRAEAKHSYGVPLCGIIPPFKVDFFLHFISAGTGVKYFFLLIHAGKRREFVSFFPSTKPLLC